MFDNLPDGVREFVWWALTGAMGAAIAAFNDPNLRPLPLLVALFSGGFVAAYGVPVVAHFIMIESHNLMIGISFFLGVSAKPIIRRLATNPFEFLKYRGKK